MENKQLNFSVPLISARRYSSPRRSNNVKGSMPFQELSLDQAVKSGSVPFRWEQSPGKAKDMNRRSIPSPELPSIAPKLPPGRALDVVPWTSTNKSGELKPVRAQNKLSGEMNFSRPRNKLSGELKVHTPQNILHGELTTPRPLKKLSGELDSSGRNKLSSSHISSLSRWEVPISGSGSRRNTTSGPETDDSAQTNAAHTVSQLESFSICCTASGVTSPGKFSTDEQAKDFMMNQFLPASKAMTLESPHYASRKKLVIVGQSAKVKALASKIEAPPTPTKTDSIIIPNRGYDVETGESEDEDINFDLPSSASVKACGFLPWFRSKNSSLRGKNPIPAMKVGAVAAFSSASKIGRIVKTMPENSQGQTLTPTKKKKAGSEANASAQLSIEDKRSGKSRPMFYSGELQTRRSSSPIYRNSSQRSISPSRNSSPPSLFHKGPGFVAVPKRVEQPNYAETMIHGGSCERYEELFSGRSSTGHDYNIPVSEKTLHIDSESTIRVSRSDSNTSKTNKLIGNGVRATPMSKASLHGERWDIMKARGICSYPISEVVDGRPSCDSTSKFDSSRYKTMKILADGKCRNLSGHLMEKIDDQCRLAPPLLKSPSDSWLLRSLSSGSPRNSFSSLCLANNPQLKKQNAQISTPGVVREPIVKRFNLRSDLEYYSKVILGRSA